MTSDKRNDILHLIGKATNFIYPLRWADEKTTAGDFDGRELAIDVFFIPTTEQIKFLAQIRSVRGHIKGITGHPCIFIFHSPDATLTHYSQLFPVTRGIFLVKGEGIKFPLPGPGGTESSPIFSDTEIHFDVKVAA